MLKPVRDQIILKVEEQEAVTAGGIVLPGQAMDKPFKGTVVAANPAFMMPNGTWKTNEVVAGDVVYFGKTHGTEIKHEGETLLVIAEEFILCKE